MSQKTQTGALYKPRGVGWGGRWEGGSKGRRDMYTYGWFMLMFDRKQQNSIKQLTYKNQSIKKKTYKPHKCLIIVSGQTNIIYSVEWNNT